MKKDNWRNRGQVMINGKYFKGNERDFLLSQFSEESLEDLITDETVIYARNIPAQSNVTYIDSYGRVSMNGGKPKEAVIDDNLGSGENHIKQIFDVIHATNPESADILNDGIEKMFGKNSRISKYKK